MPGCMAVGCTNSTEKGFLMKRFPRDPERRKQWLIKTRRDNWTPTDNSYLCEVHFAAEMWEKTREDGPRKLKANAVPTIFAFTKPTKSRKSPVKRRLLSPKKAKALPVIPLEMEAADFELNISPDQRNEPSTTTAGSLLNQPSTSELLPASQSSTSQSTSSEENLSPLPLASKSVAGSLL